MCLSLCLPPGGCELVSMIWSPTVMAQGLNAGHRLLEDHAISLPRIFLRTRPSASSVARSMSWSSFWKRISPPTILPFLEGYAGSTGLFTLLPQPPLPGDAENLARLDIETHAVDSLDHAFAREEWVCKSRTDSSDPFIPSVDGAISSTAIRHFESSVIRRPEYADRRFQQNIREKRANQCKYAKNH